MSFFITSESAFGLDISDASLRFAQLSKGKKPTLQLYNDIALPAGCIIDGEIKNQKIFLQYFNKLIKTRIGKGKLSHQIICSLPESNTFLKQLTIEKCDDPQIKDKIKEILPQHLPIAIDDLYLDYQILKKGGDGTDVLIGASPKLIVDSYIEALDKAGFIASVLEIEAAAISRVIIENNKGVCPQIVIDIGATRTGLFLYDNESIKFTVSLPISGNRITDLISKTLDLDVEKAEKAKIVCGLDPNKCHGALLEIFSETIDDLCKHISSAITFYDENFQDSKKIEKITLCGGGANFIGITNAIEQSLGIKTEVADPFINIHNPNPKYFTPQKTQSFIAAIGLGLRIVC